MPNSKSKISMPLINMIFDHTCLVKLLCNEYKDLPDIKYLFELETDSVRNYLTKHQFLFIVNKMKLNRLALCAVRLHRILPVTSIRALRFTFFRFPSILNPISTAAGSIASSPPELFVRQPD